MAFESKFDGRIVLHQDDVGMCHGANVAFWELSEAGSITSGSVMVPCPWFSEAADMAARNPVLDLGVHLTLNAEKQFYRWGPISRVTQSSGLVDADGYMWRDVSSVRRHANPGAVEVELRAQIERAIASGFDVTHLDAHMGAVFAPEFCSIYIALGVEYRLPILLTRKLSSYGPHGHITGVDDDQFAQIVREAERNDLPIFDRVLETDFKRPATRRLEHRAYEDLFARNTSGLTFAALHPNAPGEIETIEPDQFHVRTAEYELFGSTSYLNWLGEKHIRPLGMREIRDAYRNR